MRATFVRSIALAGALTLTLAACGSGGSGGDAELAAAIEASMTEDAEFMDGLDIDTTCLSEGMVDALGGAETIEEKYGITADSVENDPDFDPEFDQGDAEGIADALWDCGDMTSLFATSLAGEGGVAEDDATCLAENLDQDALKQTMAAEFMGAAGAALASEAENAMFSSVIDAFGTCNIDLSSFGE